MNSKQTKFSLGVLVIFLCAVLVVPTASGDEPGGTKINKVPIENKAVADGAIGHLQHGVIVQQTQLAGRELVSIVPSTPSITLEVGGPFAPRRPLKFGPWTASAQFGLRVESRIPFWGVKLEASPLEGPEGVLPPDRLWIRTEATEGEFQSLAQPVPIVVGDLRTPVKETFATIKVEPTWTDAPGEYQGELVMRPFVPEGGDPPPPSPDVSGILPEERAPVQVKLKIAAAISILVSGGELDFSAPSGPGDYAANEQVGFKVTTNASSWRVECQAAPLKGDDGQIPLERVLWERLDGRGQTVASGNLRDNPTVLDGHEATAGFESSLRFTIRITTEETAGNYSGSISLLGITGP